MAESNHWAVVFRSDDPAYLEVLAKVLCKAGFQVSCVALHGPDLGDAAQGATLHELRVPRARLATANQVLDTFLREAHDLDEELGESLLPPQDLSAHHDIEDEDDKVETKEFVRSGVYASLRSRRDERPED